MQDGLFLSVTHDETDTMALLLLPWRFASEYHRVSTRTGSPPAVRAKSPRPPPPARQTRCRCTGEGYIKTITMKGQLST